jgi:hypothetical protein
MKYFYVFPSFVKAHLIHSLAKCIRDLFYSKERICSAGRADLQQKKISIQGG